MAALAIQGWRHRWATDDAYINFRVVDNLLDGHGPVFNAGERVEAYTSTLWLGLLTAAHGLTGIDVAWAAVLLGLALALAGLTMATLASVLLWRGAGHEGIALPAGGAVFVVLLPTWDFATSGLETGLGFAWLGGTYLALVRLRQGTPFVGQRGSAAIAVVAGLGPLVRPDLALFSAGFLALLLVIDRRWRLVAYAAVLPVAYQVFRMGYFAAIVPNTAIAKEAGDSLWGRGWDYLVDFADPYALAIPLVALGALGALELRGTRTAPRVDILLVGVPVLCGLLHGIYVVRVGGDFMHGRLFLPTLFALLLPVMAIVPGRRPTRLAVAAVVLVWAAVCAVTLRPDYGPNPLETLRFEDERRFYVAFSGTEDPITIDDYVRAVWVADARRLAGGAPRVQLRPLSQRYVGDDPAFPDLPPRAGIPNERVGAYYAVGLVSYAVGTNVTIVDRIGLGDALAARQEFRPIVALDGSRRDARYRAGHEKNLPLAWIVARYAELDSGAGRSLARDPSVRAARAALRCGDLARLTRATTAPLDAGRFFSNLADSVRLHGFRFDADPLKTERQQCGT